jgi:spermidine/putrescine ABC transporter ATP-binding subunit
MSGPESFVALRAVSKHYGPVKAVDRVSFDIGRGEFFSLLGPSGCGKTTLLRLLGGFETPSGGEILIDGQPMSGVAPNHRPTNMVFQNYAIFPHLSVRENIAFGLDRRTLGDRNVEAEVERALELIKLPGYGDRRPHQLSGGQRQRVALARALVRRPKVLLLDEPLGALDKKLREEMQIELRQLQRSVGITFTFVTHDQEEALTMSDRIAVMSRGRVLQIDTAARLYESPNCREVAEFIGSMNFIDCRVASVSGRTVLVEANGIGPLRVVAAPEDPLPQGHTILALRPEKLQIDGASADELGEEFNRLRGRLVAQAYLGDRSHYFVAVEGLAKPLAIAAQNVVRVLEVGAEPGQEIVVHWRANAGLLLPVEPPAE